MITIVDYDAGNIRSIANMLRAIGVSARISSDPEEVVEAERLILPGVGHFDYGMRQLRNRGLVEALNTRVLRDGIPLLGICLGAQLLTRSSEEGSEEGLGWMDAQTVRFDRSRMREALRVPHMGWADVRALRPNPLLSEGDNQARFYHVHSFHLLCNDPSQEMMESYHGYPFTTGIGRDNILGVQFHPEKSHRFGMALLRAFLTWQPGSQRPAGEPAGQKTAAF